MKKRILSLLLCLVMVVGLLPVTTLAALPTMTAEITGNYLKWPAVDGAEVYCLLIDYKPEYVKAQKTSSGVQNTQQSFDLKEYCQSRYPNKWLKVQIKAYSTYPASGGTALTELLDVGSYQNTASTVMQLATPSGIQWVDNFTVSWNVVEHAEKYRVVLTREYYVLGTSYSENYYVIETTTPSVNIENHCVPDITDYRLSITAMTTKAGYLNSEPGYAYKEYEEAVLATLSKRELSGVTFDKNTGELSWDAFNKDGVTASSYLLQVLGLDPSTYVLSAETTIPAASGSMTFDVKNFCVENRLPRTNDSGSPTYSVLLSACDATGDRISAAWRDDDYTLNYDPDQVLTGTVSYSGAARYGTTLTAKVTGAPEGATLNYRWQVKDGGEWKNISGAPTTVSYYISADNAGAGVVGKEIRVKVTATNYAGTLYGAPVTVQKGWNMGIPGKPELSYSGGTLTITNYTDGQDYAWTTSLTRDETTGYAVWPTSNEGEGKELSSVTAGQTYYVYTRVKGSETMEVGRIISAVAYIVPTTGSSETGNPVKDVSYPQYPVDQRTIYIPVGGSVEVEYKIDPVDATDNMPYWKPNGYAHGITVANTDPVNGVGELKITAGTETGGPEFVGPQKSETDSTPWYYYGNGSVRPDLNLRVYVYDKTKPATVPRLNVGGGTIDLYEGDTYDLDFADLKAKDFLPNIEGASKDSYTLEAWIFNSGSLGIATNFSKDNTNIEITGDEIKAKAAGAGTVVRVYALAAGENKNSVAPIATYTVNVKARPTVLDLSITPPVLTLQAGKTYQLTVNKTPADAEGDIIWSSDKPDYVTVAADTSDSSKATVTVSDTAEAGIATITATYGTGETALTAKCIITVTAACGTNHTYVYQEQEWGHVKVCLFCGDSDDKILDHDLFWKESAENSGKMYGECIDCGYKTDLVNIPANETIKDPDSSSGGHHGGAGRPYRPGLSTAAPGGTTTAAVQSPKTGDAGIMLYAALSLMSMTGGAWLVSKKRRDR